MHRVCSYMQHDGDFHSAAKSFARKKKDLQADSAYDVGQKHTDTNRAIQRQMYITITYRS